MIIIFVIKFIFCVGMFSIVKTSDPRSLTYTAGVVEFSAVYSGTFESALKLNIKGYQDVVKKYIKPGDEVDIIVFPEACLNSEATASLIPDSKNQLMLCNRKSPNQDMLSQLSCLAKEYKKYMVFNIVEKEKCIEDNHGKCATNKSNLYYNSNVVFDRNGTLISRYRKFNLYDGPTFKTTRFPEYKTFKTDFGVEFVSIICFDLLWWTPTMEFVEKGYKHFIHPIYWYSELPFLTANQAHMGYAYAANINLLTAAGNYAGEGATGSAIFHGRRGSIVSKMTSKPTREILIAKIPKRDMSFLTQNQANEDQPRYGAVPRKLLGLTLDRDVTVNKYTSVLLKSDELSINKEVNHKHELRCIFNIHRRQFNNMDNKTHYSYRLVAYSGPRKYINSKQIKWMQTCAIIACTDDKSLDSCGKIFNDEVQYWNTHYFESIKIIGWFRSQEKRLIMPNSVDAMMKPIPSNGFTFRSTHIDHKIQTILRLTKPVSDILAFGIFADYFDGFQKVPSRRYSNQHGSSYLKHYIKTLFSG